VSEDIIQVNILSEADQINTSDHHALRLELKMPDNIRCKNKVKKKKNWRINWQATRGI
jgi:hypothetical protein